MVLIHGFPLDGESWGKQQAALLDAGYRVIAYDRRGFGDSSKTGSRLRLRHVRRRPQRADGDLDLNDAVLVGFSMGTGEVARYLVRYGSERVAKAAFLGSFEPTCSSPTTTRTAPVRRSSSTASPTRSARTGTPSSPGSSRTSTTSTRTSARASRRRRSTRASQVANHAGNAAIAAAPLTWPTDFRGDIAKIDVPALIVHGTADSILPIDVDRAALPESCCPDAMYVEIDGAPHGMLWTHADEVNEALLAFLQS